MHKKLEAELISLAHQILQMKNKGDVIKLRDKAALIHEKLAVLTFVDNYFLTTPNALENKKELQDIVEKASNVLSATTKKETAVKEETIKEAIPKEAAPVISNKIEKQNKETLKTEAEEIVSKIIDQEVVPVKSVVPIKENSLANNEEFKDSIPADVAANLFEKAEKLTQTPKSEKPQEKVIVKEDKKIKPIKTEPKQEVKTSVNDRVFSQKIQVGLNDRIAFVKHLFNYSQEDFNRVLSQLNTFNTEIAARDFINNQVKPDYNWTDKEAYETRLITLIERRFL